MNEYRLTKSAPRCDDTRCAMCGFIIYGRERHYVAECIGHVCVSCLDRYTVRFKGRDNYLVAPACAVMDCQHPAWYMTRLVGNGGQAVYYVCRGHAHMHGMGGE